MFTKFLVERNVDWDLGLNLNSDQVFFPKKLWVNVDEIVGRSE